MARHETGDVASSPGADESMCLEACRQGDRDAFRTIVVRYQPKLYAIALRMLGDRHEAEDVVQEALTKAYVALHRYDPSRPFSTWLYRIAVNACVDRSRKRRREVAVPDLEPATTPIGSDRLEQAEIIRAVEHALGALPPDYRAVLVLRDIEGLSYAEIAQILSGSIAALKIRVVRGRAMLAAVLKKLYPDLTALV
ncbi:MAG: sigma-70 family RNA polymerase sigma factor [Deltaproteobacteria bacterium]|nr:sigma-70 family RNA polymerase sigma factor [Deltaproteobacteria bacterium]